MISRPSYVCSILFIFPFKPTYSTIALLVNVLSPTHSHWLGPFLLLHLATYAPSRRL